MRNSTNLGSAWMETRKRLTGTKTCNVNGQHVNVNGQHVRNCAKQKKCGQRMDGNAKTVNGDENV